MSEIPEWHANGAKGDDSKNARIERSIIAAREGSYSALGTLFDLYRDYLLRVANDELKSDLVPKVAPSDLVQETFLQAARGFAEFKGQTEEQLRAWLRQILINNLRDATRWFGVQKRDIAREVSLDATQEFKKSVDALEGSTPSPSAALLSREDCLAIQAALGQLNELDRRVIEMRTLEGRTFHEVGDAIGRSTDAAFKVWSRAIEKLAEILPSARNDG